MRAFTHDNENNEYSHIQQINLNISVTSKQDTWWLELFPKQYLCFSQTTDSSVSDMTISRPDQWRHLSWHATNEVDDVIDVDITPLFKAWCQFSQILELGIPVMNCMHSTFQNAEILYLR